MFEEKNTKASNKKTWKAPKLTSLDGQNTEAGNTMGGVEGSPTGGFTMTYSGS